MLPLTPFGNIDLTSSRRGTTGVRADGVSQVIVWVPAAYAARYHFKDCSRLRLAVCTGVQRDSRMLPITVTMPSVARSLGYNTSKESFVSYDMPPHIPGTPSGQSMVVGTFDPDALEYLSRISQAAPLELFSSPKVYFTAPSELLSQEILDSLSAGSEVLVTYAGHQYLYNENTQATEFCVFLSPLTPRVQSLGSFDQDSYEPAYTPYFTWVQDPMRSSRARSFCNSLGQTLFADRFPLRILLTPVPASHILAQTVNPAACAARLRRI